MRGLRTKLEQISRIDHRQQAKSRATCARRPSEESKAKRTEEMANKFLKFDRLYELVKQCSIERILSKSMPEESQKEEPKECGNTIAKNGELPNRRMSMQEFGSTMAKSIKRRISLPTYSPFEGDPQFETEINNGKEIIGKVAAPKVEYSVLQYPSDSPAREDTVNNTRTSYIPANFESNELNTFDMNMTYLPTWSLQKSKLAANDMDAENLSMDLKTKNLANHIQMTYRPMNIKTIKKSNLFFYSQYKRSQKKKTLYLDKNEALPDYEEDSICCSQASKKAALKDNGEFSFWKNRKSNEVLEDSGEYSIWKYQKSRKEKKQRKKKMKAEKELDIKAVKFFEIKK